MAHIEQRPRADGRPTYRVKVKYRGELSTATFHTLIDAKAYARVADQANRARNILRASARLIRPR